jgi:hypothetical protein
MLNSKERIKDLIDSEQVLFGVEAKHSDDVKYLGPRIMGGCVLSFIAFISFLAIGDYINSEDGSILGALVSILFSFALISWAVYVIKNIFRIYRKKGNYFIATPTRLIVMCEDKIQIFHWREFTGEIKLFGKKGNKDKIFLFLERKIMSEWVPEGNAQQPVNDFIYMAGVKDAEMIEKLCKEQINKAKAEAFY